MSMRLRLPLPNRGVSILPEPLTAAPVPPRYIEIEILEHDEAKHETTLRATLDVGGYAVRTHALVVIDEIASNYNHLRDLLLHELSPALELVR